MKNIFRFILPLLLFGSRSFAQTFQLDVCVERACDGAPLANVSFPTLSPGPLAPVVTGNCATWNAVPFGGPYFIAPEQDTDPLNGVNALDIVRIARHILGIQPLGSPYALIAADVNQSTTVTTFDMVEIRKLIQGIMPDFPNNDSWRFIDADAVFSNPDNPFETAIPFTTTLTNTSDPFVAVEYKAVKVGDVDCSAQPGFSPEVDDRRVAALSLPETLFDAGESIELPLRIDEAGRWSGLQFGLLFDPSLMAVESVIPGDLLRGDELAIASPQPGTVSVVWYDLVPRVTAPGETLATLRLRALAPVRPSEAISLNAAIRPEIYTAEEEPMRLQLRFDGGRTTGNTIYTPQPNPTAAGVSIPVFLETAGTVQAELTDISGKRLWSSRWRLDAGAQAVDIPAQAMPAPGVYFWRIMAGETAGGGKLVRE